MSRPTARPVPWSVPGYEAGPPGLTALRAQVRWVLAAEAGLSWEPSRGRRLDAARGLGGAATTLDAEAVTGLAALPTQRPSLAAVPDVEPEDEPVRDAGDGADGASPTVTAPRAAPEGDQAEVMALVVRAQEGDGPAFGELYDRYVDLVFRYIHYRVGDRTLAEDLTSETFLRALRRIGTFTWQGRDVGAWFVTIARNLIADHYKSSRYRLEVSTADMLDADRATDGPEGEVLDAIANAALVEAVRRLNPEQQECVVLRFLQGLSVAETALAMGKNEGAIKALQYRAVRALGRLLPAEAVL